jgi:hypothetical protein
MKLFNVSLLIAFVAGSSITFAAAKVEHKSHEGHKHGENCGHAAIKHSGHVDHMHDGHFHSTAANGKVVEHKVRVAASKDHVKASAENGHTHGVNCGHERIEHGDHSDYVVDGNVHHVHGDHCDQVATEI